MKKATTATAARGSARKHDQLERIFLRSLTLCVGLSSLILARAEGSWFPVGVTPLLAIAAYLVTDRRRWFSLPVYAANILGGLAAIASAAEFFSGDIERKLLSGAHMLVYLTWIVLLMHKGIRQFWWLSALSVLQLAVASVLTREPMFGASLVGMLLLLIWTLSVFTLFRVRSFVADATTTSAGPAIQADSLAPGDNRRRDTGPIRVRNGLQIDAAEPWIGWRFYGVVAWTFAGSVLVAGVVFAAFPRIWVDGSPLAPSERNRNAAQHRTGFSEEVQLGEIGQIMQSDSRVLQFSIRELMTGQPVTLDEFNRSMGFDELRFRGNVLSRYSTGRWRRGITVNEDPRENASRRIPLVTRRANPFAVRITQDPPVGTFAFAVMPLINAVPDVVSGRDGWKTDIAIRRQTQTLVHSDSARNSDVPVTYEIHCPRIDPQDSRSLQIWSLSDAIRWVTNTRLSPYGVQLREELAHREAITPELRQQLPQLAELADRVCDTQTTPRPSARQCADRIMNFLQPSAGFGYSLQQQVTDPTLDPVEDFLLNHKTGHCEYFASACALMLQAKGIPARMVNGYKGSEANAVTGDLEVKQKHAHSWVEAWIDGRWQTLDPTPAAARDDDVRNAGSLSWLSDLREAFSDKWYAVVQNMTLDRQKELIRPLVERARQAADVVRQQGIWAATKLFVQQFVLSPQKWFSWQGGLITFVLLTALALLIRRRPWRLLTLAWQALRRRLSSRNRTARSVIRFYETFCETCEQHGLRFASSNTALENAAAARRFFRDSLTTDELREIPERVAAAFNSVRFGRVTLTPEQAAGIREDVLLLSQRLQTQTSDTPPQ